MKKLLTILFMLVGMTAFAQGTWTTGMTKADELTGNDGGPYYLYEVKGDGGFTLWDWNKCNFQIFTSKGTFDVWYYQSSGYRFTRIIIGLYTLDGKLKDKEDLELGADHTGQYAWINKSDLSFPSRNKIKKMLKALKSGEGYVRIICNRNGADDFDLLIPPYKQ